MVSLNFLLTQSFQPHYGPRVDSAPNRNEYKDYILGEGVKTAGVEVWPCQIHVPTVMNSGSLNFLEPSGPVQGLLYLLLDRNTVKKYE
jgi:hypothetical protein